MPSRPLMALVFGLVASATTAEAAVPANFEDVVVVGSLTQPTALAFTPDGRLLITRQPGVLRVYASGSLLTTPAITLTSMCTASEQGLLGVAVDPDFATNDFIYVYYTINKSGTCVNRVSRFVLPATNVIAPSSQVVLVDNIHSPAGNHNGGDLNFGKDGYLYVSVGDGGCDYLGDSGCAGANDASRDVNTLLGKILRVTRDGAVPPDNPFLGAGTASCRTGDAAAGIRCQETYAWGLRNPFRFAMDPGALGVRFFINDVGQSAWEEIDLGQKGADYGWNCREGAHPASTGPKCTPPPSGMVDPIFEYDSTGACGSITGGAFLPTGFWPSSFDGSYFYSDYNCGTIFRLEPSGATYASSSFATGLGSSSAVHMTFGPVAGGVGLYYTNYAGGGQVRVIRFTGTGNRSPLAEIAALPSTGSAPLLVSFDAAGSSDPDGDALTYVWSFGDGSADVETPTAATTHLYSVAGTYTAVVRAKDPAGALSDPAGIVINASNTAPVPTITSPAAAALYRVGESVTLVGSAMDAEEGALPDGRLTWNILLHHDAHTHPFLTNQVGNNITFTTPAPEDFAAAATSFLEIRLTATDTLGAATTISQSFNPRKVAVTFETSPSGLIVQANGAALVTPATVTSWESYDLTLNAPDQTKDGTPYTFVAWSDGGAQSHVFNTPATATTLGASFAGTVAPSEAVSFLAVTSGHQASHVEWFNPSAATFVSTTLVFRSGRFPTTPSDGTVLFTGGASGGRSSLDHTGLTNGTLYYYAAFVNLEGGDLSAGRFAKGRPFDSTAGPVKWAYSTGATSLAPPGLGDAVLAVSNDQIVHALARSGSGGTWPSGYTPVLLGGPVQSRPPVLPAGLVPGQPSLALLAAQDGVVYAVDPATGALVWQSSVLGESLQGAVAGGFTAYGFVADRLFIGTRNSTAPNRFYALDPATGFSIGTPYEGADGGGLGIVNAGAAVDYAASRVYFASRAATTGASTVWCLDVTPTGFVFRWSVAVGDVDGSPVLRGPRVYVGGNNGVIHAFEKDSGALAWSLPTDGQAVKGFLAPDRTGDDLYFATTGHVYGISDQGTSGSLNFPAIPVTSPSIVLFRPPDGALPPRLYFGAGDRRLHELDLSASPPTEKTVLLAGGPAVIGAPTYDVATGMIYVGSDEGVVYAVAVPLP